MRLHSFVDFIHATNRQQLSSFDDSDLVTHLCKFGQNMRAYENRFPPLG